MHLQQPSCLDHLFGPWCRGSYQHPKTGKNAGNAPSVASLYRAFAEAEQAAEADDLAQLRPRTARILQDDGPTVAEESRSS
jgi:hypothetical protein